MNELTRSPKQTMKRIKPEYNDLAYSLESRSDGVKPFGAIVITRPEYLSCTDTLRIYILNPEIVKTYTNQVPRGDISCLLQSPTAPDTRVLRNVNELRIRNTYLQGVQGNTREASNHWWVENQSGNEFSVYTDLWSSTP